MTEVKSVSAAHENITVYQQAIDALLEKQNEYQRMIDWYPDNGKNREEMELHIHTMERLIQAFLKSVNPVNF